VTDLPARFDALQNTYAERLRTSGGSQQLLQTYCQDIQVIREAIFRTLLRGYRKGFASINLPSFFKGLPGRVVESVASCTPVVSCWLDDRPETNGVFETEKDVLLFDPHDADDLRSCILRLKADSSLRERLVANARAKLLSHFVSEVQIKAILDWLSS
jgi:glycosyltransferase involved in cell wall biosynthesis